MNRLLTIPVSPYCEKARWALDRADIAYLEEGHAPVLHWRATLPLHTRTVPVLITRGAVLASSTSIVRWSDARCTGGEHLYPNDPALRREVEELEAHFDAKLGPATRRWAYSFMLHDKRRSIDVLGVAIPPGERAALVALWPMIATAMIRGMGLTPEGAARSLERVKAIFTEVSARLSDGRRFLVGDRFSAADLGFTALSIPVLAPPQYAWLPPFDTLPAPMRAEIASFRSTPAGAFALRMYRDERPRGGRFMMASA
ncbi:MAG: glutathione S-transferase [Deltaproteobacteria bacterium]|nr:glutathione S-transferase [Deltaproteobacteria bacterium]